MGMHVDFHSDVNEGLTVESSVYTYDGDDELFNFVATTIETKGGRIRLFTRSVEDIDRLAFEFETLSRRLREEFKNVPAKESKA